MGRQRVPHRVSQNSLDSSSMSEGFYPDEIMDDNNHDFLKQHREDRPVFIARMPNLEEPGSLRTFLTSQSVWNRILELKNGMTDRQQILTLRCIVVLLVCMLFWSMVSKPSSNSPDLTQKGDALTETLLDLEDEPYREEKTALPRSEGAYERLSFNSPARSSRELENDELSPVLSTTSIDLSQSVEMSKEPPSAFQSNRPSPQSASSAWDRDAYSIPSAVPMESRNFTANSSNDSSPDFSAFAIPNYGGSQRPAGTYNEPQVRQMQYSAPNFSEQATPLYSQSNPQFPSNVNPGTGVYPNSQSVPNGQQYPSEANFNTTTQNQPPLNHPNRDPRENVAYPQYNNPTDFREVIPATYTNNTYRNPGTPQAHQQWTAPQEYYGQYNPQQSTNPPNNQQYNNPQQYSQPNYGNATFPVNSLNR